MDDEIRPNPCPRSVYSVASTGDRGARLSERGPFFGVHGATKARISWRNLTLEPGKRIPAPPQPSERMDLVTEVVEAVLAVDQLRP